MAEGLAKLSDDYKVTVKQLRGKYKWLKKTWKGLNTKIRSGRGLGAKDTETPARYDLLNPSELYRRVQRE